MTSYRYVHPRPFNSNSIQCFSSAPVPEMDDDDKAMKDFLDRLKQDRLSGQQTLTSTGNGNTLHQDPLFNTLLEFALPDENAEAVDSPMALPFTAELADLKRPNSFIVNDIGNRIVACSTNHELKSALQEFVHTFFPVENNGDSGGNQIAASPKLLAAIIAKSRKLRNEHLAYALLQFIKDRGMISYVSWFNVHVYNELMFMEWEMSHSLENIWLHAKEMNSGGILANTYTKFLLEKIRKDLEKREAVSVAHFWNSQIIDSFKKSQSNIRDDEWESLLI